MEKNFDRWNEYKKRLNEKPFLHYVNERDVFWCSLGHNVGHEEDGKNENFERPVLILKKFSRDLVIIAPISSKIREGPFYYQYAFGMKDSVVLLQHIRSISTKRLLRKMTKVPTTVFLEITELARNLF